MLVKKQYVKSNDDWEKAYGECLSVYTREQIDSLTERTIEHILSISKSYNNCLNGGAA